MKWCRLSGAANRFFNILKDVMEKQNTIIIAPLGQEIYLGLSIS